MLIRAAATPEEAALLATPLAIAGIEAMPRIDIAMAGATAAACAVPACPADELPAATPAPTRSVLIATAPTIGIVVLISVISLLRV